MNLPMTQTFSPLVAYADVMRAEHKFGYAVDESPELSDYLMTWDLAHPFTPSNVLNKLYHAASRFQSLADYVLDNRIGGKDNRGIVMRIHFAELIKAIGSASLGLRVEAARSTPNKSSEVLFTTNWTHLAHRLVDEHELRDTLEGFDELM